MRQEGGLDGAPAHAGDAGQIGERDRVGQVLADVLLDAGEAGRLGRAWRRSEQMRVVVRQAGEDGADERVREAADDERRAQGAVRLLDVVEDEAHETQDARASGGADVHLRLEAGKHRPCGAGQSAERGAHHVARNHHLEALIRRAELEHPVRAWRGQGGSLARGDARCPTTLGHPTSAVERDQQRVDAHVGRVAADAGAPEAGRDAEAADRGAVRPPFEGSAALHLLQRHR
jgi:hypothetical protein